MHLLEQFRKEKATSEAVSKGKSHFLGNFQNKSHSRRENKFPKLFPESKVSRDIPERKDVYVAVPERKYISRAVPKKKKKKLV